MAIPKYYEIYYYFLKLLSDGQSHTIRDIKEFVANEFSLTDEERSELLPSGKQAMFDNRLGWTRTYLKKAGLINSPARGVFIITKQGQQLLDKHPSVINDEVLMQYDSFREFKNPESRNPVPTIQPSVEQYDTPQDQLDNAFRVINETLAEDLLSEILKQTPNYFESLVVELLQKMGYGGSLPSSGRVVGKSGDGGIDGIIKEDKLGFNLIYIQAKRYSADKTVGRPELQGFVGALAEKKRSKGLFITTSQFSKEAIRYAENQQVILIDGVTLTKLMIEYNLGVSVESTYEIKRIDTDFFNNEV